MLYSKVHLITLIMVTFTLAFLDGVNKDGYNNQTYSRDPTQQIYVVSL